MALNVRRVAPADLDRVIGTISDAFHNDPVWSWAFPDSDRRPDQFRRWWPLFVEGAIPHGFTWMGEHRGVVAPSRRSRPDVANPTMQAETISVWIPPGEQELTDKAEAQIAPLLAELLGDRSRVVLEGLLGFEAAHPHDEPHYYLSFVATQTPHRGRGIGEQLLAQNLELIDAEHLPAYLESSNPKNLARYERLGFRPIGEFSLPDNGPTVTTMWRPARWPQR